MQTVQSIREGLGLSQIELAQKSGLSHTTIWRVENKDVRINEETAKLLSQALEVEIGEIFSSQKLSIRGRPPASGCPTAKSPSVAQIVCGECFMLTNGSLPTCNSCGAPLS